MENYKLKFTRLQNEIFRLLCINSGKKLNQREIAKCLNVSSTAVAKATPLLEKEDLILLDKETRMNLIRISFNRNSQKAIDFKRVENLKRIYESGLVSFLENSFSGSTIILFGSYSKGDDIYSSDIDIAIIGCKEKSFVAKVTKNKRVYVPKRFNKDFPKGSEVEIKKMDLHFFKSFLEKEININCYRSLKEIHKNLKENLFNGIVLSGGIDLWEI